MSIYFLLLLIMILLLYQGIICSLVYAPKKIKIISVMALVLMSFRYITLIVFFIIKSQNYLYLLKPLIFTNLLCIPICGVICVSIFSRSNKLKLKRILFMCVLLGIAYFLVIYKSTSSINISKNYGYIIQLNLEFYCYVVMIIINSIFFIKGLNLYNKSYASKLGAILIIISSGITLVSVILTSINTNFSWTLLGDISWIITINYGLIKFKR
jgi:hypothetical protein